MSGAGAPSVAVVGGGITGLVAAYRLRRLLGAHARIVLLEGSERLGGKLRTVPLAGDPVDVGAEAFIGRRPEVPALLEELGLSDQLVHPSGARPLIYAGAALHPLPSGTLMGIPADAGSLTGLVDADTLARIAAEPTVPLYWDRAGDVSVADLVADRFGEQVVRRSVDPLLGGVYSGLSDTAGVRATLPTLAAALDAGAPSLSEAVTRALPEPSDAPVFGTLRDGYGTLLDALEKAADAEIRHAAASGLRRAGGRWNLDPIGPVDGVVLAVPADRAAELLADAVPAAAAQASRIPLASSAVVALALPSGAALPQNSGILVATGEDLSAKAFTLSSRKWPHLAGRDVALARASFGRYGEAAIVDAPDDELIARARADLAAVTGVTDEPVATFVQRWHGGLPQYRAGHLDVVAVLEDAIATVDGLEVAGAMLHGVGVPACVASGTTAATRLATRVAG
ncbi:MULTISPECIES: protoporphyrinogen oxidase [Rhodococcus]|uniref:protoporphyrinogen oxidase n=1 Tax=Rhodococcus TaxID=1827 RepID=UPI000622CF6D|nr:MULTISPECIES: protoporphyrinogen oxidase [Rhodococcus]AKE89899.1 protoporphyrinogen oxidase [Rhodococcus aetherivorans]ANZ25377.1 protoporphyrinogen oxidase [Rhodococcus sp. WB1]QIX50363.1 protoporphyrinogen oxidase [Rhodococcus sp. DMU1]